ncbi:hypothetical protein JW949_02250 [Candidatus Woesearchaeota archaeon]|nr:hypothetical protein [Candidatus Woesearchaeota archaeon]
MDYKINEDKYKIEIRGSPGEIRKFIRALDQIVIGRSNERSSNLEECINNLNNIPDLKQFYFNNEEIICFNNYLIKYMVPSEKKSAAYSCFPRLKKHFNEAVDFMNELNKQNFFDVL